MCCSRSSANVLWLPAFLVAALACSPSARATTLIVPDQSPTIQGAIDAVVDTILIRPGTYPETLVTRQQFSLMSASDPAGSPPVIAGLTFGGSAFQLFEFRHLQFSEPIFIDAADWQVKFSDCDLPRITVDPGSVAASFLWFHRCRLSGGPWLSARRAVLDSCHLTGGVAMLRGDEFIARACTVEGAPFLGISSGSMVACVEGNTVLGSGVTVDCDSAVVVNNLVEGGVGISCSRSRVAYVRRNTVRGALSGVTADCESVVVANNLIEDCERFGIYDESRWHTTIENNVIRRCGAACIQAESNVILVLGNTLSESGSHGIVFLSGEPEVVGNIVSGSRYNGIDYDGAAPRGVKVINNTVCLNGYDGINVTNDFPGDECVGNVGYGNGIFGVRWESTTGAIFACNDWFGNGYAGIWDRSPSESEFSVDPQFCDAQGGDFHLQADSPLLTWPGCERVGALGVGCGVTATLVRRFTAERVSDGIRVEWEIAPGATASEVWLERAEEDASSVWIRPLTERSSDAGAMVELDRSALGNRAYRYRLVAQEGAGIAVIGHEVRVEAEARLGFGLLKVGPNPGNGPVRVAFSLEHAAAVEIDVFDVQGRHVAALVRGTVAAGVHSVEWIGAGHSGLYLVRYRYPGGEQTRSMLRVR